ncbi:MAG: hypothetical protein M3499_00715 [Actinomycetota bacterium]|nr:hypothetical protein [Actinomycetota bacterium]
MSSRCLKLDGLQEAVIDELLHPTPQRVVGLDQLDRITDPVEVVRVDQEVQIDAGTLTLAVVPPGLGGDTFSRRYLDAAVAQPVVELAERGPQATVVGSLQEVIAGQRIPP